MKHSWMLFAACLLILTIFPHFDASAQELAKIIFSIAWSPDGSKIAVGTPSKIEILDATDGTLIKTLKGSRYVVSAVDWSLDSTKVAGASSGPNGLAVWDVATGQIIAAQSFDAIAIKWNPDNIRIAAADTSINIGIWNTLTGQNAPLALQGNVMDWSPDGDKLARASYDDSPIQITDIATQQTLLTLPGHKYGVGSLDWSPDGNKIASGGADKIVKIWNATTGESLFTLTGHSDVVSAVAWNWNTTILASASSDGTVRFWNAQTGELISVVQAEGQIRAISWSPDGSKIVYGGDEGIVHVIPAPQAQTPTPSPSPSAQETATPNRILAVAWSPDLSHVAIGDTDGLIRIIDANTSQPALTIQGHTAGVASIAWSPDGSRIISGGLSPDDSARIWNIADGKLMYQFSNVGTDVLAVGWSPDGNQVVAIPAEEKGRIWNPSNGNLISTLQIGTVTDMRWSPDGTKIAFSLAGGAIDIREASNFQRVVYAEVNSRPPGGGHQIVNVSWSPDGNRIAGSTLNGKVWIWDAATGQNTLTLAANDYTGDDILLRRVANLSFSLDGSTISSLSGEGTIRTWDAKTGQVLQTVQLDGQVSAAAWSPDGTQLAYAVGDTLQIILTPQVQTPTPQPDTLPDYPRPPYKLAYSPDGSMIAGSADRLLRVWDATTGATLIDFPTMDSTYVLDVTWSPDSKRIATASDDQFVRIWNIGDSNYKPGQLLSTIQPVTNEFGILTSVGWSPNGKLLAIGSVMEPFSLKIWDANTYLQLNQFTAGWVERLAWHPDSDSNKIIVADDNGGTAFVSGIDTPSTVSFSHIGRNDPATAMNWNSDGSQIAIGYNGGKIVIWSTYTNTQVSNMDTGVQGRIYALAWSTDDQQLASTNGNGMVQIWNTSTGELIESLPGTSAAVAFSPDGRKLVYAAGPGAIQIVDVPDISTPTP
ncbi:MAG: hypothetical protein ABI690_05285 [Chloroflexota bacterium]